MTTPAYIYVSDQGRVFASTHEPTEEDLAYAKVGMVVIIRLADYYFYGTGKTWASIASGRLGRAKIEGQLTQPFHGTVSDFEPPDHVHDEIVELFEQQISTPPNGGSNPADARRRRFTSS
jgi:hypothetical protein